MCRNILVLFSGRRRRDGSAGQNRSNKHPERNLVCKDIVKIFEDIDPDLWKPFCSVSLINDNGTNKLWFCLTLKAAGSAASACLILLSGSNIGESRSVCLFKLWSHKSFDSSDRELPGSRGSGCAAVCRADPTPGQEDEELLKARSGQGDDE